MISLKAQIRAVSQRLPGSPPASFAGVRKVAKILFSRTNSRKSPYQTRSWSSSFSFRFPRLRPVLDGEPIVIVRDGEPIDRNLKRERVTLGEVEAEARLQQIDSLRKVKWAVLETSGKISFLVDDKA